ncbi:hypothetical protein [Marinifilum sp. D714]|uniref:hypothetical protein n=1 Tax=Marinifilum sp. D714 TaxID=2937523 RepID=UPI0027CD4039|nr:hypothetical protein [Marinifilum sp. D714]MDQ2178095.1 hypothetical protein [Marinifilum sp. D714]
MIETRKLLIAISIGLMFTGCNTSGQKTEQSNCEPNKVPVDTVINKLIQADLFNITDLKYLDSAKQDLIDSYVKYDYFGGYTYPDSLRYVDFRFYNIDSEELFEIGGLTEYLDLVKPTFERLEIKFDYKNERSIDNDNYWKHTIEINGKEYVAFEGIMESHDLWDKAYLNFIEMLNDQLRLQTSEEQFYPIRSANDGMMVMLTKKQFEIVKKYYPNDNDHPKSIDNWINQNK